MAFECEKPGRRSEPSDRHATDPIVTRTDFNSKSDVRNYKIELKPQLMGVDRLKDTDPMVIAWLTWTRFNLENERDGL